MVRWLLSKSQIMDDRIDKNMQITTFGKGFRQSINVKHDKLLNKDNNILIKLRGIL